MSRPLRRTDSLIERISISSVDELVNAAAKTARDSGVKGESTNIPVLPASSARLFGYMPIFCCAISRHGVNSLITTAVPNGGTIASTARLVVVQPRFSFRPGRGPLLNLSTPGDHSYVTVPVGRRAASPAILRSCSFRILCLL